MGKESRTKSYKNSKHQNAWRDQKKHNRNSYKSDHWKKPQRSNAKREFVPKVNLREDQVGITEFVTDSLGFTAVFKSRFSDFHVNEIDLNEKVLVLNNLDIPQGVEKTLSAEELTAAREELRDVITTELWDKIKNLAQCKRGSEEDQPIEIEINNLDKEQRTQIHKVIKKLYAQKLISSTVTLSNEDGKEADEKKIIRIAKPKGERGDNRQSWPFSGEFVHFLLYKENMDTNEVTAAMAERMNLRPSQVNYCGTKDKRAKTTQKLCVKRRVPSQIVGSVKMLRGAYVGNFEFSNEVLKLGDLKGNRFRIALRHVNGKQEDIEVALQQLRERGFINYFGLQRFGNCASIPTYEIGVALLKSDYKLACELILKPRENDPSFLQTIRETWWKDRNSVAAAAKFRNDKFIEKKLLDGLAQYGEHDYASALRKIPRNMLLLYPHAFQSLIFNRVASRRIKEYGLQLIPGDLVYRNKDELDVDTSSEAVDEPMESNVENNEEMSVDAEAQTAETESIFKRKVKALTASDISSGDYTLFDVVLPLPGYDVTYPDNAVGEWYEQVLQEHELSSEKLRHNVKTYAMAGAYRKLLIQPTQMTWQFCRYDNPESTLIASDWELLKGSKETNGENTNENTKGKFLALILDFCLPTAAYATMLLRELLKNDTSAASQTQLEQSELKKAGLTGEDNHEAEAEVAQAEAVPVTLEKRKADVQLQFDDEKDAKKSKTDL